jgi:hypothetical protein
MAAYPVDKPRATVQGRKKPAGRRNRPAGPKGGEAVYTLTEYGVMGPDGVEYATMAEALEANA